MSARLLELRARAGVAFNRALTRLLRRVGLRETVIGWRRGAQRALRTAAEARGSDRFSRPAPNGMEAALDAIIDRDGGFFVEAGANDGFTQSNTYWLERFRAWRGLLVEPMPEQAGEARKSRRRSVVVECALVAADYRQPTVRMRFGDLMSTVAGAQDADWAQRGLALGWRDPYELDVPARTLSSLLDEIAAPDIDLLSLDVEGFEAPALRGLDLARHAPRYVLVEIHDPEVNRPPIDAILAERYDEHGWLSGSDLLYVRRDIATANRREERAGPA